MGGYLASLKDILIHYCHLVRFETLRYQFHSFIPPTPYPNSETNSLYYDFKAVEQNQDCVVKIFYSECQTRLTGISYKKIEKDYNKAYTCYLMPFTYPHGPKADGWCPVLSGLPGSVTHHLGVNGA
jgi:hypothetical protein